MVLCNLIELNYVIYAVPKLAEPLCVNLLQLQFKRLCKGFRPHLIETNKDISNELIFSDVFSDVYLSVNYIGSLAKCK